MSGAFTTGILAGLIAGFTLAAVAGGLVRDDEIRAGAFQRNGVAYKIERMAQ